MDAAKELHLLEASLRASVRLVLGNDWKSAKGAPNISALEAKRLEESKRRDGVLTSADLLEYTEFYALADLISKNWEMFQPVFDDKKRFDVFIGLANDVRNAIAHSRDLVIHEEQLFAGLAGQLRNQIAIHRSQMNSSSTYYPLIESLTDQFGRDGSGGLYGEVERPRLNVGDVLRFSGTAISARGKRLRWYTLFGDGTFSPPATVMLGQEVAEGDSVAFEFSIDENHVSEQGWVHIKIASDSAYHRHSGISPEVPHDDLRSFAIAVNPPIDG